MLREIIIGCRKRRRKDQKELYELFYAYGMSITLRYADSRNEAVDILNDAFMKVFENIRQYDSGRPFKPWLRQIIVNTAITHFHKARKMNKWESLDEAWPEPISGERITSGISYDEIVEMVQKLTPAYRTVFNLHVIEGFSHEEIAGLLDISVGTSKSNLSKAKRNLRALLENKLI
ncbi:MAG: RNA polymerase sigma factor [Balneolaceae bacterium]|nr:RNA polymerase sigma factor [Balneolaceae bacterium]